MIELKNIKKSYGHNIIFNIENLELIDKGIIYIKGESGIGKTTFINCLCGLDCFDQGEILINGEKEENLSSYSSFCYQDFQLISSMTILENLKLINNDINQIKNILKKLDVLELLNSKAYNLSGGQKQRISIARCLLENRNVIVFDEPLANLDIDNRNNLLDLFKEISIDHLVIIVSHDKIDDKYYDQKIEFFEDEIKSNIVNKNNGTIQKNTDQNNKKKNIFKLAFNFLFKSKQGIISSIIMFLCLSITFGCLLIISSDKTKIKENIYQSMNVDYTVFVNKANDNFYSCDNSMTSEYKVTTNLSLQVEIDNKEFTINNIWHKNNAMESDSVITFSNDILSDLESKQGIANITNFDLNYNYITEPCIANALTNTIICNDSIYEELYKKSYDKCYSVSLFYNDLDIGLSDLKSINENEMSCSYGSSEVENNDIVITTRIAYNLALKLGIDSYDKLIDKEIPLTLQCDSFEKENQIRKESSKLKIKGIVNDNDAIIYFNNRQALQMKEKFSYNSFKNKLNGIGIINPNYEAFKHYSNIGLTDYSTTNGNYKSISGMIDNNKVLLITVSIIFAALYLAVMLFFSLNLISINSNNIGILYTLHYSKKDIFSILGIQIMVISIIVSLAASLGGSGILLIFNKLIDAKSMIVSINIFYFIIDFIIPLIIGIIMSISNYYILKRKNIISLIYSKDR